MPFEVLGLAAARALQVPMPAAALTQQLIQTAIGHGHGKSDYVSLYEVAARAAGLPRERTICHDTPWR